MRLYAYQDRFGCDRFGVLDQGGLLTGGRLERRGGLGKGLTHLGIEALVRTSDRWPERLDRAVRRVDRLAGRRRLALDGRTAAPALRQPGKIVCVGLNYLDHAAEAGRSAPSRPMLFAKFANAVVADGEPVVRPEGTHALDLEVELGVVIGRRATRVGRAQAMDHVAGYVVVNDVTARDWQGNPPALRDGEKGDGQWLRAKGSDTFLPMGPTFVTADELDPAAGLGLRSYRIPGAGQPDAGQEILMQDGTTADMIWDVPALIEFISRAITLEPGDVIATGTPAGVGVFRDPPVFLEPGDRVRCEIDGIGSVENPIVDWSQA